MSQLDSAGARFRAAVAEEHPLQVMGAITAYAGRMAKRVGYRALYLSGGGVAANSLGMPDLGISTMEDVLIDARRIVDATQMPLLVDIDTGWGGAFNIGRTIKEMIKAGAAAVHIEDQVMAKRCGHRPNKSIVSAEEMGDRIKTAVDARSDANFVIMARTDAFASEGLNAAIDRALYYAQLGADMIFAEAISQLDDFKKFTQSLPIPVLANATEFGKTPLFTQEQYKKAGIAMILYPLSAFRSMSQAALKTYETIIQTGSQESILDSMQTRQELYDILDYNRYEHIMDELTRRP